MTGFEQFPALLIIIPLLSALIIGIVGQFDKRFCHPIAVLALLGSLYASVKTLCQVLESGPVHYRLGGWAPPFGIEYVVDHLNGLVLVVISFVALLAVLFAKESVKKDLPDKIPHFYLLYILLVTGLLGMTVTGDAFNLYVLMEITALTNYALIAIGRDRALISGFNYVIMGTIGACFYLLGVGHLYIMTGSLNMADLSNILPALYGSNAILVAFILILVGLWIKMAFFPLHGWLPNAYTYAPSATGALIAPLMTKVTIYIMIRVMFSIFSPAFVYETFAMHSAVVWMAVVAIVGGSILALAQRDFKKMLTYLVVAEVGYMVGGVWLANRNGITGAILHIMNDALMTLCLFLVVGIIVYKRGGHHFDDLRGLYRKMPVTMGAFTIGALSMIGVPPLAGFFSKWYLILGAIDGGQWGFMAALIFSSLVNAVLFFRVIEVGYFEPFREHHGDEGHGHHPEPIDEAPFSMLAPLVIVSISLIVAGLYTGDIVTAIIQFTVPAGI
ncbi:MAG: monovalent cation/H+ antiporter subunit D family protein [Deltaproteobacteria bacterium]|nr:monovalent cation/H+ antiporter subunit D family protein [Deltaproteobacteria bacterium]